MSMSTHIIGFRAPDEQWKKMKDVYEACVEAGIKIPEAVDDFFGGEMPADSGVTVNLNNYLEDSSVKEYNEPGRFGYTIDIRELQKLHPNITHIRFYNSY